MAAKQRWFEMKGEAGKVAKTRGEKRFKVERFTNGKKSATEFYVGDKIPKGLMQLEKTGKVNIVQL